MSDRIAVFNEGRVEQVATPVELYENPTSAFVAGFVGTSNLLTGGAATTVLGKAGSFTIRPEKVQIVNGRGPSGLHVESGVVRDVSYAGMITRYLVALDDGGELQVVRQNLETSSEDVRDEGGRKVKIGWRPEHTVAVQGEEDQQ